MAATTFPDSPVASVVSLELEVAEFAPHDDRRIVIESLLNDAKDALLQFAVDDIEDGFLEQYSDKHDLLNSSVGATASVYTTPAKPMVDAHESDFDSFVYYCLESAASSKNHRRRLKNAASASNSRARRKWFLFHACQELNAQHTLIHGLAQVVSRLDSTASDEAAVRAAVQDMTSQLQAYKTASVWTETFASEISTLQPQTAPTSCAPRAVVSSRRGGGV